MVGHMAYLRVLRDALRRDEDSVQFTISAAGYSLDALPTLNDNAALAVLASELLFARTDPRIGAAAESIMARAITGRAHTVHVRVGVLLALHHELCGAAQAAENLLTPLLDETQRCHTHRLILDFPQLAPILQRLRTPYSQSLLSRLSTIVGKFRPFGLTVQETACLRLIIEGHRITDVAAHMNLAEQSIRVYLKRIYRKLGVHSRVEAVRVAQEAGMGATE
jgi:DNA-binding CsgD family transcriptional regulator